MVEECVHQALTAVECRFPQHVGPRAGGEYYAGVLPVHVERPGGHDHGERRAAQEGDDVPGTWALHFERREKQSKQAALVLLGAETNRHILESFLALLPAQDKPSQLPDMPEGNLSLLFSSPQEAVLMYATPTQFGRLARVVQGISMEESGFIAPALLTADLATMQEAMRVFGVREFTVEGYRTEDVLARLQGR